MSSKSLFKFQSIVAIVLFTTSILSVVTSAEAQTKTEAAAPTTATQSDSQWTAYNKCMEKNNFSTEACAPVASQISAMTGVTPTDKCSQADQKTNTLFSSSNSATQNLFSVEKEQIQAKNQANDTVAQSALAHRSADRDYTQAVSAISIQLPIEMQKADDQAAQAVQLLRQKMAALSDSVIAANSEIRAAESAIETATTDRDATCLVNADAAEKAKLKAIDDAFAVTQATKKINYASDALAGADTRRKTKRIADIQAAYLNEYRDCMNGMGDGAMKAKAITDATNALAKAKQAYAEKIASITTQKALLNQDLLNQSNASQTTKSAIQAQAATQMAQLFTKYQNDVDAADTRAAQATKDLTASVGLMSQEQGIATQNATIASQQWQSSMSGLQLCNGDPNTSKQAKIPDGYVAPAPTAAH